MSPILAIVGRPNVGKSRLFNRIVGQRRAIVAGMPGVTRDRHYAAADWAGRSFIAVDTGGLDLDPAADLERKITEQSVRAIGEADAVVCLFDGQCEPTAADREVVDLIRRAGKPTVFAVNKIDEPLHGGRIHAYHELGASPIVAVSAEHGMGVDDLLDAAVGLFPTGEKAPEEGGALRVAVVGRPNVGKSTLVNRLAGEERVVAHERPGTTRDAIDVEIAFEGKGYVLVDTAGVRRHLMGAEGVERWSAMGSLRSIERAGVVLQLIAAPEGLTRQDLHLAGFVTEQGKGLIILANKWDLMGEGWEGYRGKLEGKMGEMKDVPLLPISAATGQNCLKIFGLIGRQENSLGKRIATSALNRLLERALAEHHLPTHKGKEVRIYYATQVQVNPPTFALFANFPAAVPYTWRRYLMRRIKEGLGLKGVPVRLVCRGK